MQPLRRAASLVLIWGVLWGAVGCGNMTDLLRMHTEGPPPAPEEPVVTWKYNESVRQLADWSARMWRQVWARGCAQGAAIAEQAARAAEAVSGFVGPPGEALPLPAADADTPVVVAEVEPVVRRAQKEQRKHNRRVHQWREEMDMYRYASVEREWGFGLPVLGTIAGLAALGFGVLAALKAVWKWKTTLWQVFLGVKAYLSEADQASATILKANLSEKMDASSKAVVDKLYKKTGE